MTIKDHKITAIIPALNEEKSLGLVLADLPPCIDRIIVCDNGSTDRTARVAKEGGAEVVYESRMGYGAACLKAVESVDAETDVLLFLDADYSDFPKEAQRVLQPIIDGGYDLVVGSRIKTLKDHHALPPVAVLGNWLSTNLIRILWGAAFTDLGPFRAISFDSYKAIHMQDRDFGWTVEMQVKAAKLGLRCLEVPVSYRPRIGVSKISGTFLGSIRAGTKILWIIFREILKGRR